MKRFFFRLEKLLQLRKVSEGRVQRELGWAMQNLNQWQEKEAMLQRQTASLMVEIQKKRDQGDHALQETYTQILDHLNASLAQVQQTLLGQNKQIEEQQERLTRAIQERKVIEKLKEKNYTQWKADTQKTEDVLLDEISVTYHEQNSRQDE